VARPKPAGLVGSLSGLWSTWLDPAFKRYDEQKRTRSSNVLYETRFRDDPTWPCDHLRFLRTPFTGGRNNLINPLRVH